MTDIVQLYLDLLDSQRESAFAALEGLTEDQIWQRPAPKEWCLGEILDHTYVSASSVFRYVESAWKRQQRRAEKHRDRPYATEIEDPYRKPTFPMWVGIFLKPHRTPRHPVPLEKFREEDRILRRDMRTFYTGKALDLLGNVYIYDPLLGSANLIVILRISIYHDQLHFDDVIKMAKALRN